MTEEHTHPPEGERSPPTPFQLLCFSLATQIQMALGLVPDLVDQKVHVDLPAAQQGIDLLSMLEEKTKGNLDEEETKLLSQMLAQFRMFYVERLKQGAEAAPATENTEETVDAEGAEETEAKSEDAAS